MVKSREVAPYNQAVTGLMDEWKQGTNALTIVVRTLGNGGGSISSPDAKPVVIVAVGTEATRWAVTNSTVPVVFCMVANVQQSILANLPAADESRVSGVSLDIPAETQLRRMMTVLPRVKRVGVIYDPKKSAATVAEMRKAAGQLGLEVVSQEVEGETALPDATARVASRIDLLWSPVDSTVFNSRSAQFVLMQMLERRVPVMGFSENMVKAGALLGPRVDYEEVGRQTAALLRASVDHREPDGGRIQGPREFRLVVNGRVLRLLGGPISPSVMQVADVIGNEE
ncbi:MAG TPA: ABC transporter substrate binding protein [Verrucomicrobiae bacterium]|nr:ABC transporter substrate binding protein [Verrucomicrobiae bacterium]